jgi:hypothetical protein
MNKVTVEHYAGWFGTTEAELTIDDKGLGVIDEEAELVFTRGQCHSLAVAIHEETGWPIYGLYTKFDSGDNSPSHCLVYSPTLNNFIDIKGPDAINRLNVFEPYKTATRKEVTVEDVNNFSGYLPLNVTAARPFAKTILQELNIKC